jgi:ubiquitin carboxyl-terminal hydrolase 4/11
VAAKEEEETLELSDCFEKFGMEEELGEEDGWYCSKCNKHRPALKTLSLWRLPSLLIVHLKRFGSMQHKITGQVRVRKRWSLRSL